MVGWFNIILGITALFIILINLLILKNINFSSDINDPGNFIGIIIFRFLPLLGHLLGGYLLIKK